MRNMKTLIRLMGAVTLSTTAASSVVACGATQAAELNGKYAKLLGWYGTNDKSKIEQDLSEDYTKIDLKKGSSEIITGTSFSSKLLTSNKAKDDDAAAFLKELGFTSSATNKEYSETDVNAINALKATIKSKNLGKIKQKPITGEKDIFKIAVGNCQVEIMNKDEADAKVVKSYTVSIAKNEALNIDGKVNELIPNKDALNLTAAEGFEKEQPVSNFKLKLAPGDNQKKFDNLVKLLNTKVSTKFYTVTTNGTEVTGNFSASATVHLQIIFGNIPMGTRIACFVPA